MEMSKFTLFFFLIVLAASACRDPNEQNGKCTACSPIQINVNGFCFVKLRGCLEYQQNGTCKQCQFGYVLSSEICIRQAIFNQNNDNSPAPLQPNNPGTLTLEELKNILGELYGAKFPYVHEHFLQKYPEIGSGEISSVETLKTSTSTIFDFIYTSQGQNYEAIASIGRKNQVQELLFQKVKTQKEANIIEAINFIRSTMGNRLVQHVLYEIRKENSTYYIDYLDFQTKKGVRAILPNQALFISDPLQLAVSVSIVDITLQDIVQEKVEQKFPQLKAHSLNNVTYIGEFIVLYYGKVNENPPTSVSVRIQDSEYQINTPIQEIQRTAENFDANFFGFNDNSDPRYLGSLGFTILEFPQLTDAELIHVQSQNVDGINFIFTFYLPQTQETYKIKVFYSFKGEASLIDAYKGTQQLFTSLHNYNRDPLFFENYPSALKQTKVINVPEIVIVSKKIIGAQITYKVSYEIDEYLKFQINNKTKNIKIIEYYLGGTDISGSPLLQKRSSEELLTYLVSQKSQASEARPSSISYNLPYYTVNFVLSTGTYSAIIEDDGSKLSLIQYQKVSSVSCFQLSVAEIQTDLTIQQIDQRLRSLYPLGAFNIQLIQVQVLPLKDLKYRFLYSNLKLQQIEIYLIHQEGKQVQVQKASLLNFGFEIQQPSNVTNSPYQVALSSIQKSENTIYEPFFTESNSNFIRTFYETGEKTVELTIDKNTNASYPYLISEKSYISVPPGFQFKFLIVPEVQNIFHTAETKKTLDLIVLEATQKYPYYISEPSIRFAQYENKDTFGIFTILLKTKRSFIRIASEVRKGANNVETRKLTSLVITRYTDSDFSSCPRFTSEGKCSVCPRQQLLFQDSCFNRVDGCLIQPGDQCIKCDANYIQKDYKCLRQCSALLI